MSKKIIKCLKDSIDEKGNYCYSLPVETTKAVIKELNRLNNIINELEQFINNQNYWVCELGYKEFTPYIPAKKIIDKLKELKENK